MQWTNKVQYKQYFYLHLVVRTTVLNSRYLPLSAHLYIVVHDLYSIRSVHSNLFSGSLVCPVECELSADFAFI
jgi:hypothetical protein